MNIYDDLNHAELIAEIRRITEEVLIPLADAKGHDYAGQAAETDALANVGQDLGWPGAFFRGRDKDQRLRTFMTQRELKVTDDSVENCFVDRLLYAYFAYIMWLRRNCDTFIEFVPIEELTMHMVSSLALDEIRKPTPPPNVDQAGKPWVEDRR
jgi:hypothetical protein